MVKTGLAKIVFASKNTFCQKLVVKNLLTFTIVYITLLDSCLFFLQQEMANTVS